MAQKRATSGSDPRVAALLPADGEDASTLREALARMDPRATHPADLPSLLEIVSANPVDLIICDDRAEDPVAAYTAVRRALADPDATGAPAFLAVIEGGAAAQRDLDRDPAYTHFLARPLRAETLTALARALCDDAGWRSPGRDEGPAVNVRRPARFSARPLYAECVVFARDSFEAARLGSGPDMDAARLLAERLHTSLLQSNLILNRALEPYKRFDIATHCVNVAIFAARIALSLELSLRDTLRVIEAGLVHDIGMARLPEAILERDGPLTDEERAEMQRHPIYGARIASELGPGYEWLERALRQEHERAGGQGYPEGLAGDEIDLAARILGVADVFEAFSHARSYRSPFTAYEALERVMEMRGEHFADEIVDALADEISVFPLDSYVQLSSGAIGRVVSTNPENLMRPTIEVLWDETWAPVEPLIVELSASPDLVIERPLHESEVPIT